MLESSVVSVVLWVLALTLTLWIVVPALAFALRLGGGLRTDVVTAVGPPPVVGGDAAFEPQWRELEALGFRADARTIQHGWFVMPTFWHWRQFETTRCLVSPDGRTHANLYRLVDEEPARIAFITMFENGGLVRTACPGGVAKEAAQPNYWRTDFFGLGAGKLLAEHQQLVESFERERATRARTATTAEITAASDAAERPLVRKMMRSFAYTMLAVLSVFIIAFFVQPARWSSMTALSICMIAGVYAFMIWLARGPLMRWTARQAHDPNFVKNVHPDARPPDVAADGAILATGKVERRLRVLAAVAALLCCAWPIAMAWRLPVILVRYGVSGVLFQLLFMVGVSFLCLQLFGRARGKLVRHKNPAEVWSNPPLLGLFFMNYLDWSKGTFYRVLTVVGVLSLLVAYAGWRLEKKRGQ